MVMSMVGVLGVLCGGQRRFGGSAAKAAADTMMRRCNRIDVVGRRRPRRRPRRIAGG